MTGGALPWSAWAGLRLAAAALCVLAATHAFAAEDTAGAETVEAQSAEANPNDRLGGKLDPQLPQTTGSEVENYCANIVDEARDQRYLRQKQELEDLQKRVDERIALMQQRSDYYREWLAKREKFLEVAEGTLTEIYQKMRPDSAAEQLSLIHPSVAAAIVMKLSPRLSSQILNEMEAKKAASLASIIADAASRELPKDPT
ncbi:MotE family protein [Pseudohoeflea coraliihabitans]|uniref:MotE family protein n=1 Tax=Pseudohoeflea coraliihabitans TaxID=2860393 RepID=A0ABS6WP11_9HYPH|nr:MotE family protein [Pseudohoeflea sp. DP4N28-3]MBW3097368.1 MotE family protein [Pseudohoeflea sp. DP4N28-3]